MQMLKDAGHEVSNARKKFAAIVDINQILIKNDVCDSIILYPFVIVVSVFWRVEHRRLFDMMIQESILLVQCQYLDTRDT
jgi:hypothetical protein